MIRVLSAAMCTVTESIALAGIKAMAFIRNLIGLVEEICDHPHEFASTVNASSPNTFRKRLFVTVAGENNRTK
jgi:hypothetical protein